VLAAPGGQRGDDVRLGRRGSGCNNKKCKKKLCVIFHVAVPFGPIPFAAEPVRAAVAAGLRNKRNRGRDVITADGGAAVQGERRVVVQSPSPWRLRRIQGGGVAADSGFPGAEHSPVLWIS